MQQQSKYELIEMQHLFSKNSRNVQLGLTLIELNLKESNLEQTCEILVKLIKNNFLDEELINTLMIHIQMVPTSSEWVRKVIQIYEMILEDCYFQDFKLAKSLIKYICSSYKKELVARKQGMIYFERLLAQFCYDFEAGSKIFHKYRNFEQLCLDNNKLKADKGNPTIEKEQQDIYFSQTNFRKAITNNIRTLYQRELKLPLKDIDIIWDEYTQWEQNQSEVQMMEPIYKSQSSMVMKIGEFEKLFRKVMSFDETSVAISPNEILQHIADLLKEKEINLSKAINFYELGLQSLHLNSTQDSQRKQLYASIWEHFIMFLQQNGNTSQQLKYIKRVSKYLEPNLRWYQLYLRSLEQNNKEDEEIEQDFSRLLADLPEKFEQCVLLNWRLCYYTRKFMNRLSNMTPEIKQGQIAKIRDLYSESIQFIHNNVDDAQYIDSHQRWAKVEAFAFGDYASSQQVLERLVKTHNDSAEIWKGYINITNMNQCTTTAQRDRYRGILKRACELIKDKDDNELMILEWIEFENCFGTVQELQNAEEKLIQHNNIDEENSEAIEEEEVDEEEVQEQKVKFKRKQDVPIQEKLDSKGTKRKRYFDENEMQEELQQEETEIEDKLKKKIKTVQKENTKIFVDSEKTIFVRNIPLDCVEEELIAQLSNSQDVQECRFVMTKTKEFKGYAYIDFENASQAEKGALELNNKHFKGSKLYAAVSKPPKVTKDDSLTLFLNNLPFSATEDSIKQKLSVNSQIEVQDIRLIKDNDGRSKGYAYVEFKDQESLTHTITLFQEHPLIEGRKVYVDKSDSLAVIKKKQIQALKQGKKKDLFIGMELTQVFIPRDQQHKPKGFAFVEFALQKDFLKALQLKDAKIHGRPVEIFKSDREITNRKQSRTTMEEDSKDEIIKPKSNADFKKFL